jgi:hypothetical protein
MLLAGCFQTAMIEDSYFSASWCAKTYMKNHQNQQLQFPINVYIDSSMSDDDIEVTVLAISTWNSTMTAPVFAPIISDDVIDRSVCGSIFVSTGDLPKDYAGYAWWDSCSARIKFEPNQRKEFALMVVIHELGHSLNLHHEDDRASVLHAVVYEDQEISDMSQCLVGHALREGGID